MSKHQPLEQQPWHMVTRRISLVLAIQAVIVVALSYYVGLFISQAFHFPLPQVGGLWCIISSIIVLQAMLSESVAAASIRILGSWLGSFFSCITAYWIGVNIPSLCVCVFLIVLVASLCRVPQIFRLACLTASIVIIVGMMEPHTSPLINALSRFLESAAGALIALAITSIFLPLRQKLHLMEEV